MKQAIARPLKKYFSCFDRLSMNGNSSIFSILLPFALSMSKGERSLFQQAVSSGFLAASILFFLSACESELIRQQEEQIRIQQEEIARQRREIEEIVAARQKEEQKRRNCNLAFGHFEKAQAAKEPRAAVELYRRGLDLCPEDDVAHYELGKSLASMGMTREAQQEFEAALKINPNFRGAKQELEKIQKRY